MRKIFTLTAALAAFLLATSVSAGTVTAKRLDCGNEYVTCPTTGDGTDLIDGQALNGVAATLTVVVDLSFGDPNELAQYSQAKIAVQYTKGAGDALTGVYYCSIDGTNYGQITSRAVGAGAGTLSLYTETLASASSSLLAVVDVATCVKFKMIFASTGAPNATDLLTIQAAVTAGG